MKFTESIEFYEKVARLMEEAAKQHPEGSPCRNRKLKIAAGCRWKIALMQMVHILRVHAQTTQESCTRQD